LIRILPEIERYRSSFGQTEVTKGAGGVDPELLAKVLANPEMATLARNLK